MSETVNFEKIGDLEDQLNDLTFYEVVSKVERPKDIVGKVEQLENELNAELAKYKLPQEIVDAFNNQLKSYVQRGIPIEFEKHYGVKRFLPNGDISLFHEWYETNEVAFGGIDAKVIVHSYHPTLTSILLPLCSDMRNFAFSSKLEASYFGEFSKISKDQSLFRVCVDVIKEIYELMYSEGNVENLLSLRSYWTPIPDDFKNFKGVVSSTDEVEICMTFYEADGKRRYFDLVDNTPEIGPLYEILADLALDDSIPQLAGAIIGHVAEIAVTLEGDLLKQLNFELDSNHMFRISMALYEIGRLRERLHWKLEHEPSAILGNKFGPSTSRATAERMYASERWIKRSNEILRTIQIPYKSNGNVHKTKAAQAVLQALEKENNIYFPKKVDTIKRELDFSFLGNTS